jgi:hypothetical protein
MRDWDWLALLYVLNSALLFTHEIDSGFWREWELFRLPGGVSGFLVANLVLILAVQLGFRSVVLRRRGRLRWALLLAAAGVIAALIHGSFLAAGTPEFRTTTSIGLLATWLVGSILQSAMIAREARQRPA